MKKKILILALVVVMIAIMLTSFTMAYFTDTDSQKNVMTTGKVDISQAEQQLGTDGSLVDFVQDKPLMPMVDTRADKKAESIVNGYFDPAMKNVVDKIITVKNEAEEGAVNQDAYVRTILAFETGTEYVANTATVRRDGKEIFETYFGVLGDFTILDRSTITIDGVEYVLAVKVYEKALEPQEVSTPSLKQIFLAPTANNEVTLLFGSEYTILALSQGTQTAGFTSAEEALNTAFGDLTDENADNYVSDETLTEWLSAATTNENANP